MHASWYRWVVLAVFSFVNLAIQLLWISFAPITSASASVYGVSELAIGGLAMVFMVAFLPLSLPASWLIDGRGFKVGVGLGAVVMAIFAPLRGLAGGHFPSVLVCTIMLAAAQPFFLNAWTKCAALWFPKRERATAVGIITLANLVGTGMGMALTPLLMRTMTVPSIQLLYGALASLSSVLFLLLARERPMQPPEPGESEVRSLMMDGLKDALRLRGFQVYLAIMFVGMGLFNGITTWIEGIVKPSGLDAEQAGAIGAILLAAGVVGAVVIPAWSDRSGERKKFLIAGLALAVPGVVAFTMTTSFVATAMAAAWFGFWMTSTLPVGMQYAAELTQPAPEGTSSGLIQLVGQGSVVFVFLMEATKTPSGSFAPSLWVGAGMLIASAIAATALPSTTQR
jgi:MFS family permease